MLALPHVASGKVREIYAVDAEHLLFVASDRISAYDVILPSEIPGKGQVLTGLSLFFFDHLEVPNHLVSTDIASLDLAPADQHRLAGRSMIVRKAEVVPLECVVRGYLYGSAWREYAAGGGPTTEHLPPGLRQADRLPEPVFTPATKAAAGHDENIDEAEARRLVGDEVYDTVRRMSLEIYRTASAHAETRGVILADTKFEFGVVDGQVVLVDEVLTPDSSRWWPAESWRPAGAVPSFDKQYVRDWLDASGWDRTPPAPELPDEVITGTRARYVEAYERITDQSFDVYLEESGG
ncbi:MAG: phosphoribosylaminoimidazolesuccinocarboxamide synthase [Acidimicrobiia bacterium]|nr:phosphoribosylaminoimidazolesuccinocarboxamide synthase [Acidimicrobiia bacterium]